MASLNKRQQAEVVDGAITKSTVTRDEMEVPCANVDCKVNRLESDMISFVILVGSPGHRDLSPLSCLDGYHWACSIDCWKIVATACIEEHMAEYLVDLHLSNDKSLHHDDAVKKDGARSE